jgi:DNA polymerase-3 subunit epsilon
MGKEFLAGLPDKPGVYRMYRSTGDLLYIGKARSIRSRVNSYFRRRSRHPEHILEMLSQAQNLKTSVTNTAFEAAVQEADEIKRYSPPYNRALRPEERYILFYSKDLRSHKSRPDSSHPIGPLPPKNYMNSIVTMIDLLEGKVTSYTREVGETVLAVYPEYTPEKSCFESGLLTFKQEFKDQLKAPVELSTLMTLGLQFWKEQLDEKDAKPDLAEQEGGAEEESEGSEERGWTPERVVKALKRTIRIGAFQIRRSRWFCRLYESALAWKRTEESLDGQNLVIFEKGIPHFKSSGMSSKREDTPPGHQKSLLERQKGFDLPTYDRMRVVTTEIRRLIQEGREVELCLHPGVVLNTPQLQKMLRWV